MAMWALYNEGEPTNISANLRVGNDSNTFENMSQRDQQMGMCHDPSHGFWP